MTEDQHEALVAVEPGWFPNGGYFACREGWFELLLGLLQSLKAAGASAENMKVVQVKEKFGTLRFYVSLETEDDALRDRLYGIIAKAEAASESICEDCGGGPTERKGTKPRSWIRVLCAECRAAEAKALGIAP